MSSPDYYSGILDLEGLDPALDDPIHHWDDGACQRALMRSLLQTGRAEMVLALIRNGLFSSKLGDKVSRALAVKDSVFRGLPGVIQAEVHRLGPRALAEGELRLWRAATRNNQRMTLAVEEPVRRDWRRRRIDAARAEEVLRFYKVTFSYIWELMAANSLVETLYNYSITLEKMRRLGVREFLDYGAGIGTFVLAAMNLGATAHHMDVPSRTLEFARWRYSARRKSVHVLEARGDHSDIPASPAIVCLEVIEHVFEPLKLLDAFRQAIPLGGILVVSESCRYLDKFISHLPANRWLGGRRFDRVLAKRGFEEVLAEPAVHPRIFRRVR